MKKNIVIIILIIVILGLTGGLIFSIYKLSNKNNELSAVTQEVDELREKVENSAPAVEEEKEEVKVIPAIDSNNITSYDGTKINPIINLYPSNSSSAGILLSYSSNKVRINVNRAEAVNYYMEVAQNDVYKELDEFDANIVQLSIMATGQAPGGEKIMILLDDGNVYYLNGSDVVKGDFTVHKVEYLSDIVRLSSANISSPDGMGYIGIIAQKIDGAAILLDTANM